MLVVGGGGGSGGGGVDRGWPLSIVGPWGALVKFQIEAFVDRRWRGKFGWVEWWTRVAGRGWMVAVGVASGLGVRGVCRGW